MVKTSVLNDALKTINNAEKAGKRQCMIRPSSKVIIKFLSVMQKHGMHINLIHTHHHFPSQRQPYPV
jgi:ribosomal protein S8